MKVTACEKEKTQQGIHLFCKQSRIPLFWVNNVFHCKNIRLVEAVADMRDSFDELHLDGLVRVSDSKSGAAIVQRKVYNVLAEMLEKRIGFGVNDIFIKMVKEHQSYSLYCITRFKEAFSTQRPAALSSQEDALASSFARKMKELLGRGPKWCRTVILDEHLLLLELDGFFSLAEQQRAAEEGDYECSVEKLARQNLVQLMDAITGNLVPTACTPIWNIAQNKVLVLLTTTHSFS